jgi:hypothetical protein
VFVSTDKATLNPVTNITSARLITGGANIYKASTASLASVQRGPLYGITTAPSQLPAISTMGVFPLRVCSLPSKDKTARSTVLDVQAPAATSDAAIGLEVGNRTYVVVAGIAHLVPDRTLLGSATALKGTEALLRSLPQGQEIKPYSGPSKNNTPIRGKNVVGTIVYTGDQTDKSTWQYYIQLMDGYSPISYLDAMVNPGTPSAISREAVAAARSEDKESSATLGVPMGPVTFSSVDTTKTTVCATYTADNVAPKVTIGDSVADLGDDPPAPAVTTYDRVTTAPGGGALLQSLGTQPDGATFLLWQGHKYGIPDMTSRTALGYGPDNKPTIGVVQPALLSLIPDGMPPGVALDREHANHPA